MLNDAGAISSAPSSVSRPRSGVVRAGRGRRSRDDRVTATAARPTTVRAQYMVAADGAHSRVREALGHPHARPRLVLEQRDDLLPRRRERRCCRRPEPERHLRRTIRSCAASSASRSRSTAASSPSTRSAIPASPITDVVDGSDRGAMPRAGAHRARHARHSGQDREHDEVEGDVRTSPSASSTGRVFIAGRRGARDAAQRRLRRQRRHPGRAQPGVEAGDGA